MNFWVFTGSPVVWLIALMGVIAVGLFFVRVLALRRAHIDYVDFIHGVGNLLASGKSEEALVLCDETAVPVARVVAAAIRRRAESQRALRESVDMAGRAEVGRIERRFAAVAIIAQTAPLLGLLGAVIGCMRTVNAANASALVARADLFEGMMNALLPVAMGLLVGIVAQVFYGILRVRFERLVTELEAAASEVLALLSSQRKGWAK